ncbi:MAG: dihydroorotate dehydrogenase electron transfer subunit [candidate division Zixibacteria bacterium]|nr:dihydroorotate dehydrogenase electron transfer subunit [candidate division Zixibacteria bacterium]
MKCSGNFQIASIERLSSNIIRLEIDSPPIAEQARPGQFVQVRIPGKETNIWPRPFSIHYAGDGRITLYIKILGKMTACMAKLKNGDILNITGPLGNGFAEPPDQVPLYLVAGGIGLPPLYFLVCILLKKGFPPELIHLYSGAKSAADLFARDEIVALNIDYRLATDDGSCGVKGLIVEPFAKDFEKSKSGAVYACGPMAMLAAVAKIAEKNFCQLSLEQLMPCGWGVCNGCAVKLKSDNSIVEDERGFRLARVCKEGPVFNADDILWD